jgi:hypothetical protein
MKPIWRGWLREARTREQVLEEITKYQPMSIDTAKDLYFNQYETAKRIQKIARAVNTNTVNLTSDEFEKIACFF